MSRLFKKGKRSDYPPLKIQFEEGQRAFYNGKVINPYPVFQMRHKEWERGFNFAYFRNKYKRRRRYAK